MVFGCILVFVFMEWSLCCISGVVLDVGYGDG